MNMSKIVISKITISSGLGGCTSKQIGDIKTHFQNLFSKFLRNRIATTTMCKKSNALFKIRKGMPLGFKATIRKKEKKELLNHLIKIYPNFYDLLAYDSNSLCLGVKSHRQLKLENYNHKAPEYGMIFQLKFEPVGSRIKYRRINPLKLKINMDKNNCVNRVKEYVEH